MQYVDLSIPIVNGIPSFPGEPGGYIIPFAAHEVQGWVSHQLLLYTHLGTHVDAPSHFIPSGKGVLDWDLAQLIGPALIIKLSHGINGGEELRRQDFQWPRPLVAGDRIVVHTGWDKAWGTDQYFKNFPSLGLELVEYLVGCNIGLLAMDTPTPHASQADAVHQLLLSNGTVIVEGLANIDRIPVVEGQIICLPLPLQGLDGSPARVVFGYETESRDSNGEAAPW
ncbi:MAG: cyclase family protein [Bacilli bacterium]